MSYRKKILVVEDNQLNRDMLSAILSDEYQVLEAENGQVALEILREHAASISLVLLDVMMPVMDGYTFLDHVQKDAELSLIPVIVTTQSTSEADELSALAHGATDFVPKPYRPKVILHRIAALIKLREAAAMINQLQYDRLTGLYTREFFFQKVRERLLEDPDGDYCIICSNVENFKLVNDIFGVLAGDNLLKEFAGLTMQTAGGTGFCGRFGADRILSFQKRERVFEGQRFIAYPEQTQFSAILKSVVLRWGIYEITDRSVSVEQMCDRAVLAVDSIKNHFEERYAVYNDSLYNKLMQERAITSAMEAALDEGQFVVYYQPKYSLHSNCISGAEALVRWIHPEWGFMSPGTFIPLFEKNGFIPRLDHYVWEQVCMQLRAWREKGYPMLPVSVNISRADAFQASLVENLVALTRKYDIDPAYLHMEITESAYSENPEQIVRTVTDLRKAGFIVEMDDFGSGYSSLNMLSQMSLDILKLDMKFIQNEIAKPVDQSLLTDVINMAHRVNLQVVAEGVETREQVNRLRAEDCDYVQGYFISKPLPAADYEVWLKDWQPPQSEEDSGSEASHQQQCLLIVDKDDAYRAKVRSTFADQFLVLELETAADVLHSIRSGAFSSLSAVILDASLPDHGAETILTALHQTPAFWDVPVLATIPSGDCVSESPVALETDDFLCKCHPQFDLKRRVQRLIDINTFHERECALRDAAYRDPLTGLLNRRGLRSAMEELHESDLPIAVCYFDLDDLKPINDTFGHDIGDRSLRIFAEVLRDMTLPEELQCRYGGDEFIAVLKQSASADAALERAQEICRVFHERTAALGLDSGCTAGVALCHPGEPLTPELIEHADRALYRAKRENRGSSCLWTAAE